jgi:putative ABC transport system ATP-binding protein
LTESTSLPKGQFTAVMGPSGSGKSTLMHALAGLDTIDAGTVRVGDIDVSSLSEKQRTLLRRDQIGFVFQAFNLVPTLTARENVLLPLTLAGSRPDAAWFDQLVSTLGVGDRLEHRPSELSGGEQQRVAVGRALINRPQLVFADEPTGNLDSSNSRSMSNSPTSLTASTSSSAAARPSVLHTASRSSEILSPTPQ